MIEKMKRFSFLVYHKEYEEFLKIVRSLGVIHIIETHKGDVEENSQLYHNLVNLRRTNTALTFLKKRLPKGALLQKDKKKGIHHLKVIEELRTSADRTEAAIQLLDKEIERLRVWGHFSHTQIRRLQDNGYFLTFYQCTERSFKPEWTEQYNAVVIKKSSSHIYFVTVTRDSLNDEIQADKMRLGEHSYKQLEQERIQLEKDLSRIHEHMAQHAIEDIVTLEHLAVELENSIEFEKAKLHTDGLAENTVMAIEGWAPVKNEAMIREKLNEMGNYYQISEPQEGDNVPILLRNNKFARLFEVIGELYSLPNYQALDLTPYFAPFYAIFFGVCLGDIGYGMLMIFASMLMIGKAKESMKSIWKLAGWLGLSTIIFGGISGTFFGISLIDSSWPWLTQLKMFMLDSNQLFNMALIMGAVQISFGMIIKGVWLMVSKGFKYSIDTWGWLLCLWGNGAIFGLTQGGYLVASQEQIALYAVNGIAFFCMLLFNDPDSSLLSNFGGGLWKLYNRLTGILGDMLSYIRLFALSISGSVMGLVFNQLAISFAGDSPGVGGIFIMVFILLIGHSMNIFMSVLGAFVHPMRLTFVEFYNNAGFESGGKKYKPFKTQKIEE